MDKKTNALDKIKIPIKLGPKLRPGRPAKILSKKIIPAPDVVAFNPGGVKMDEVAWKETFRTNAVNAGLVERVNDPWKHRSRGMTCVACMWSILKAPSTIVGRCRRHAPTLSGYPAVYMTDWCGDFKLDENKV